MNSREYKNGLNSKKRKKIQDRSKIIIIKINLVLKCRITNRSRSHHDLVKGWTTNRCQVEP